MRQHTRDPIGERVTKAVRLYAFVDNNPILKSDNLGLDINIPYATPRNCCGMPVKVYDPNTHCCCKNGTVVSSDLSSECKLVDKKEIPSGAVMHKANGIPMPDAPKQIHVWLSWPGGSADSNAPNNVGKVSSGAAYQLDDYPTEDVNLSPCEYDFTKFYKCLSDTASSQHGDNGPKCYTFVDQLLRACKAASKGCTAK